jgi:hypothetical protein
VVEGESLETGFYASRCARDDPSSPPAITMAFVAEVDIPDYLVEMVAVVLL